MAESESPNGADKDHYEAERRLNLLTSSLSDVHANIARLNRDVGSMIPDPEAHSAKSKVKAWLFQNLTWILSVIAGGGYLYVEWREQKVEERIHNAQFERRVEERFKEVGSDINKLQEKRIAPLEKDIKKIKSFQVLHYEEQRRLLLEGLPRSKRNELKEEPPELKEAKKALLKE